MLPAFHISFDIPKSLPHSCFFNAACFGVWITAACISRCLSFGIAGGEFSLGRVSKV
jgi:hypothetical protein